MPEDFYWIGFIEVFFGKFGECGKDGMSSRVYSAEQLRSRDVSIGELGIAITNVAGIGEDRSEEMVKVSDQMQAKISRGIRDPF